MIGHLTLWRSWVATRERGEWAREIASLRSMEPAVVSFRHPADDVERRLGGPRARAGQARLASAQSVADRARH